MPGGAGSQDGRQARWDRHNAERRRDIISAALTVIEAGEPGAEVQVQQIAQQAGLSRTVVYRHFSDRADLDRAVQAAIIEQLWDELLPSVRLDGTVPQVIERIVSTYVGWAVAHPALHRMADHETGDGSGPLEEGLELIAGQVTEILLAGLATFGVALTEEDVAGLDPLVYGIVGAVFTAVRRWLGRPGQELSAHGLIELVSTSVWFVVDGHARRLGAVIDPELPVEALIADALAGAPAQATAPLGS